MTVDITVPLDTELVSRWPYWVRGVRELINNIEVDVIDDIWVEHEISLVSGEEHAITVPTAKIVFGIVSVTSTDPAYLHNVSGMGNGSILILSCWGSTEVILRRTGNLFFTAPTWDQTWTLEPNGIIIFANNGGVPPVIDGMFGEVCRVAGHDQ